MAISGSDWRSVFDAPVQSQFRRCVHYNRRRTRRRRPTIASHTLDAGAGEVFLVGGAVRDALLGRPVRERDWVVVGATPDALRRRGFRQVGRDFPVFLHPETHEEYALARTERKTGQGHTGFECYAGQDVTIEQDLGRRDLTINALAQAEDGRLIDPWGGRSDLEARVLRHVSPAFEEDPLRVFRVARLAAELANLGFVVAPATRELMREMAVRGDLRELPAERVWQELARALEASAPARFFEVLAESAALAPWFIELEPIVTRLTRLLAQFADSLDRFAALGAMLSAAEVEALCQRLKAPGRFRRVALDVAALGPLLVRWRELDVDVVLRAIKDGGALRRPADFTRLVRVLAATQDEDLGQLLVVAGRLRDVTAAPLRARGLEGARLGTALEREMQAIIAASR